MFSTGENRLFICPYKFYSADYFSPYDSDENNVVSLIQTILQITDKLEAGITDYDVVDTMVDDMIEAMIR